ncbi:MAG: deoxyribonuclease IV [archaeon]
MQPKLRFGPAGMPLAMKGRKLAEGIEYTANEGLNAFEVEFVRGVRGNKEDWAEAKLTAKKNDVLLSCHAPYYINCCSPSKDKQQTSVRNLLQTARAAELLGAYIIVFHPGYYQGQSPEQAMSRCVSVLREVIKKMKSEKLHCILGAETTGKQSAFGSLDENIKLAKILPEVKPVIDFAHLHARANGSIKSKEDYEKIFDKIKKELGEDYLKQMHCHFAEIEFTEKGERRHLSLGERWQPDFRQLAKVIKSKKLMLTIISESPNLDLDALEMQKLAE